MKEITKNNHYVPQSYLKKWSQDKKRIWGHQLLVSHNAVPEWKAYSIRNIAFHEYLYTNMCDGIESDEFEHWFSTNYESPVESPLRKVINNEDISDEEMRKIIDFAAAQSVRTPVQLLKSMKLLDEVLPGILENALKETVKKLETAKATGIPLEKIEKDSLADLIPLKVTKGIEDGSKEGFIGAETSNGRGTWLYGIKYVLLNTVKILHKHSWSIMHAPPGAMWATSDDPVVCLNYYGDNKFDFGGGWGRKGSDIIFPLSPKHILYTNVGTTNDRHLFLDYAMFNKMQRVIIEHAHRCVFAHEPILNIGKVRKRVVSETMYQEEKMKWKNWIEEQRAIETEMRR